jgi:hypothetical protein
MEQLDSDAFRLCKNRGLIFTDEYVMLLPLFVKRLIWHMQRITGAVQMVLGSEQDI